MDQYQKVEKPKAETPINENELRIIVQGRMRNYISYAMTLLQEKGAKKIVLKATGRAINKTVMIAELIMVYGALRIIVKIFLMWNSKMVIDGGEDTTVATSWLEASNLVAQICHRDLKLENTLLDGSPAPRLKICDFGYSKSSLFCGIQDPNQQLELQHI
ncbi:hypothetical protein ES319_D03G022700v1 [Gossypium barbadense]|uniref:Protein kinase domain-containing protein n=1 Tax=Gossypium barbadense TaxID=3634 RepID=A0A5J5RZY6_GOSBA|nr:hypothetical protein ES319_D03G022700v1 [Gossypium barbadense]